MSVPGISRALFVDTNDSKSSPYGAESYEGKRFKEAVFPRHIDVVRESKESDKSVHDFVLYDHFEDDLRHSPPPVPPPTPEGMSLQDKIETKA